MQISLNLLITFFDVFILGYLVFTTWLGYKTGALVKAIALFALSGGLLLSATIVRWTYRYFSEVHAKNPEVFASLVLAITFALSIWFSEYVQKVVYLQTKEIEVNKTSRILGAIFGFAKGFIISAITSLVILGLNVSGKFLPDKEPRSALANITSAIIAYTVRPLKPIYQKIYESNQKNYEKKQDEKEQDEKEQDEKTDDIDTTEKPPPEKPTDNPVKTNRINPNQPIENINEENNFLK